MSKLRITLFSLLGSLLIAVTVSVAGLLPNSFFRVDKKQQVSWDRKDKAFFVDEGPAVDHIIDDFYFPHYDEAGNEKFILKGKKAMLINNKRYRIERPEICLRGGLSRGDSASSPESSVTGPETSRDIIITSKMGELDKDTNEGLLTKGVVVELGQGTTLKTDHLRYYPNENKAKTDRPVTLHGEKMKIRGEGLEARLSTDHIWVEREVVAELGGVRGNILLSSLGGLPTETKSQDTKTVIQCKGKLIYEREANILTFHEKVRVRQGVSTLRTDKLVLIFDEKGQRVKMLIAEGDVLASDGVRVAKGKSMYWDAITDTTTIEDAPSAEFFEEKFTLIAPKIIFSQGGQRADAPKGGQLNAKGASKTKEEAAKGQNLGGVTITWKGRMTYHRGLEQATFEEDVQLTKKDYTIYCQKMLINFEGKEIKAKTMQAWGDVHVVERSGGLMREANGQEGFWDFEKDIAELKGEGTLFLQTELGQKREDGVTIDWSQKMRVQDAKRKITFHENVRAVRGQQKIDCNQLNTFLGEGNELERAVALGDVFFVDNREGGIESIGDTMEWDYQSDRVVISGEPTAEARRQGSRTFAKRIYYNLKTKQVGWKDRPHLEVPMKGGDTVVPLLSNPFSAR